MGTIKQSPLPMGTIRGGAGSTLGSDFDANNRTLDAPSSHISTIRRDIASAEMQGIHRTDYDKPWLSKRERERENVNM